MIRVIIADDSAFMRRALKMILEKDPEITVIALAKNGLEAVELVKKLDPDVLTLDIEMPELNGIEALKRIINEHPIPVIMISSLTTAGAKETIQALEIGAVDYISKDIDHTKLNVLKIENEIINKIKSIARRKHIIKSRLLRKNIQQRHILEERNFLDDEYKNLILADGQKIKIVAIGASTGGPGALQNIITMLPENLPCSIVVAQHMPAGFTKTFAERLNTLSKIIVKEAEDHELIEDSTVYIAPGNYNMYLVKESAKVFIKLDERDFGSLYKPCVDVLITSVAEIFGRRALGIILTGMGSDGLKGIKCLKEKHGIVIAQDEVTSIIYGMPKAIVDNKLADLILPIEEISKNIIKIVS